MMPACASSDSTASTTKTVKLVVIEYRFISHLLNPLHYMRRQSTAVGVVILHKHLSRAREHDLPAGTTDRIQGSAKPEDFRGRRQTKNRRKQACDLYLAIPLS
jgi:hypothetical protein